MAPKKKKNPKNDFYFFMQDQKKVFQREGRAWNNMEELVAMCHPLFKQLGEADKQRYKAMAKQWKAQDKLDLSNKFNHEGRSLLDIENERKAEEEAQMHIKRETLETVESAFAKGTLADEKFYIVHFNYLCEVKKGGSFLPCELAVAEFSLRNGVTRYLQAFIKPSSVPIGYSYEIMNTAQSTHRLDLDSAPLLDKAASSYSWIVKRLLSMICPSGNLSLMPPLYTLSELHKSCVAMFEDLFIESGYARPVLKNIDILHVDELLFHLAVQLRGSRGLSRTLATDEMKTTHYDYTPEVSCPYHEALDCSRYCSLFIVRKWAYVIADICCPLLELPLIPSRHCPPNVESRYLRQDPEQVKVVFDGSDQKWSKVEMTASTSTSVQDCVDLGTHVELDWVVKPSAVFSQLSESPMPVPGPKDDADSQSGPAKGVWSAKVQAKAASSVPKIEDSNDFPALGAKPKRRGQDDQSAVNTLSDHLKRM